MSTKKTKAQLAVESRHAFVLAVCEVLKIVGARCVEEPKPCPEAKGPRRASAHFDVSGGRWELDLDGNQLHVAPYSKWIACRFENKPTGLIRAAALRNGESLNPFSFKWNFHFTIEEPGAKEAREFGLALCSLMPLEKAAPLVEMLSDPTSAAPVAGLVEADVERMRGLLKGAGLDATVRAYHGVSIRLPPPSGTYFGLHTRRQFEEAVRKIEAGEPPLDVLKAVSG